MLQQFQDYVKKNGLLPAEGSTLLAVSGGMDSVVLTDLYCRAGYPVAVAHCNFRLRGSESEQDKEFVRKLAGHYDVPFYSKDFDTSDYAEKKGVSIQMAARELRYSWFDELLQHKRLNTLATGHHLDDAIETFFINLLRGSGIRGIHGILPKQGYTVHPLLFTGRKKIDDYVRQNQLRYREDSSNQSMKYRRNAIRHQLLPVLESLHTGYRETLAENFERIRQAEAIFKHKVREEEQRIVIRKGVRRYYPVAALLKLQPIEGYLYEFLAPYNFHYRDVTHIAEALNGIPGKAFYSETHVLVKDRDDLIIAPRETIPDEKYTIEEEQQEVNEPVVLKISKQPFSSDVVISGKKNVAMLDYDKLSFPLQLRKWERGDRFCPLGMQKQKKVSDFFVDNKLSLLDKKNTWLLTSGRDIVWIIGHRIDDRYKVTESTRNILRIEKSEE